MFTAGELETLSVFKAASVILLFWVFLRRKTDLLCEHGLKIDQLTDSSAA